MILNLLMFIIGLHRHQSNEKLINTRRALMVALVLPRCTRSPPAGRRKRSHPAQPYPRPYASSVDISPHIRPPSRAWSYDPVVEVLPAAIFPLSAAEALARASSLLRASSSTVIVGSRAAPCVS